MLEKEIEKKLRVRITKMGCLFEKFTSPGRRGVSDRIITIPGRPAHIIFLELKAEGGQEEPLQKRQREIRLSMGSDARLVTGWAEAEAFAEEVRQICDTIRIPTSEPART